MARTAPSNASLPRDDEERRPSSSPTSPRAVGGDGRRIISSFQPLLVEVAGSMDDPTQQQLTARLRRYRNRYALIFRLMATIAAQRVSEDELFGDDSKPPLLFASPRAAITVDGGRLTILPRFHPRGSFQEEDTTNAINTFEHYMNYQFLSAALTHNMLRYRRQHSNMAGAEDGTPRPPLPRFTEEDSENFVVRHYVHESTRTASFMIADIRTRCAAVIDPRQCGAHAGRSEYEEDLQTLGLRLTHIVVTHYWADLAMGVEELCARHPSVVICAGGGVPAGAVAGTVALSPSLQLRCIAIPSFSPESVVVELRLCGELLALFCGPVWSTDAVPRADLSSTVSLHDDGMLQCEEDVVRRCQVNLKRFFYDRYLLPPSSPSSSPTTDSGTTTTPTATDVPESEEGFMANAVPWKECVVLFPSHGGYSNVTNQLDLYWAAHLGDLLRMRHSRTVIDTLLSPEAYAAYYAKMPRLPRPPLFLANRRWNGRSILRLTQGGSPEAAPTPSLASSSPSTEVVWVDVRDAPLYHRLHPAAAVLVPMSFPAEVYGAKRAELWLQCLLLPGQKVMALCGSPGQREVVRDRLRLLSPTSVVEVSTVEELLPLPAGEGTWSPEAIYARHAASARAVGDRMCFASAGAAGHVWWIYAPHPLKRLATPESLVALDVGPSSATIVVDLRTPFEFKNGSHQQSVHVSLAELCEMMVAHTQALIAAAQHHDEEGSGYPPLPVRPLAEQYMVKLHQQALMNEVPVVDARRDIRRLVLYCAGGYRSLIAESLLQRAVELTWMANSWTSHATMEATIEVVDVVGGAFQIMTQRPDLWQVKDRSIICIS